MQLMTATSDRFPTFPLCQNYLKDLPCLDCNRISSVPWITVPFSLHTGPYIPLRRLCSRSLRPLVTRDRWTMVPLLPWSASTFLLLTIPLITVFFPVVCSLTSASTKRHWHGFSHTLATDIKVHTYDNDIRCWCVRYGTGPQTNITAC